MRGAIAIIETPVLTFLSPLDCPGQQRQDQGRSAASGIAHQSDAALDLMNTFAGPCIRIGDAETKDQDADSVEYPIQYVGISCRLNPSLKHTLLTFTRRDQTRIATHFLPSAIT